MVGFFPHLQAHGFGPSYTWLISISKPFMVAGAKEESQEAEETGCWWLTPVILATWEAEIRRIKV
jgi:hypothetical protein